MRERCCSPELCTMEIELRSMADMNLLLQVIIGKYYYCYRLLSTANVVPPVSKVGVRVRRSPSKVPVIFIQVSIN
jgi:hypothetical protein